MIDLKSIKSAYNCQQEVERILGAPASKTSKTLVWRCPMHNDDTPSFHVYDNGFYCYGCGVHGDILDFWQWATKKGLAGVLADHNISLTAEEVLQRKVDAAQRDIEAAQRKLDEVQSALIELRSGGLREKYHANLDEYDGMGRVLWENRGVPVWYQEKVFLGYDNDHNWGDVHSASLTIPVYETGYNLINIRHRLIDPPEGFGKYRPERHGLPQSLFVADPDKPLEGTCLVCEGEIKSMVAYVTDPDMQVVGIPGKTPGRELLGKLENFSEVNLCLDPDADPMPLARQLGAERVRIVRLPEKIDDMIVALGLDRDWMRQIVRQARAA